MARTRRFNRHFLLFLSLCVALAIIIPLSILLLNVTFTVTVFSLLTFEFALSSVPLIGPIFMATSTALVTGLAFLAISSGLQKRSQPIYLMPPAPSPSQTMLLRDNFGYRRFQQTPCPCNFNRTPLTFWSQPTPPPAYNPFITEHPAPTAPPLDEVDLLNSTAPR